MADEVIPVPLAEQTVPARDIVITAGLVIRGQLDTTVLSDALTELVKRWPKLGGTTCMQQEGSYLVPSSTDC